MWFVFQFKTYTWTEQVDRETVYNFNHFLTDNCRSKSYKDILLFFNMGRWGEVVEWFAGDRATISSETQQRTFWNLWKPFPSIKLFVILDWFYEEYLIP
eukprot:UN10148